MIDDTEVARLAAELGAAYEACPEEGVPAFEAMARRALELYPPAPPAADRRAELYTAVIRALTALMTFEMGDDSTGIRRFTRAQKLAQLAQEIAASYATRASDVVDMPGVGGIGDARDMLATEADPDVMRPAGAPYVNHNAMLPPYRGYAANPDLLPPPAMQTAIATIRELMEPMLRPRPTAPASAAEIRAGRLADLMQAREAAVAIFHDTADIDARIRTLVLEINDAPDAPPEPQSTGAPP